RGATHDSHCPSGLNWPPARVGLPKNAVRSISGALVTAAVLSFISDPVQASMPEARITPARWAERRIESPLFCDGARSLVPLGAQCQRRTPFGLKLLSQPAAPLAARLRFP